LHPRGRWWLLPTVARKLVRFISFSRLTTMSGQLGLAWQRPGFERSVVLSLCSDRSCSWSHTQRHGRARIMLEHPGWGSRQLPWKKHERHWRMGSDWSSSRARSKSPTRSYRRLIHFPPSADASIHQSLTASQFDVQAGMMAPALHTLNACALFAWASPHWTARCSVVEFARSK